MVHKQLAKTRIQSQEYGYGREISSYTERVLRRANYAVFLGLARTVYIYGVHTEFLIRKSPNNRSYTVQA